MGIDIYAQWKGQTEEEDEKQSTGFNIFMGHVGYLREAYHGEPYATKYLVSEAFADKDGEAKISAKILKERLPKTLALVKERQEKVYENDSEEDIIKVQDSFTAFVYLCEEKEKDTGEECTIIASY